VRPDPTRSKRVAIVTGASSGIGRAIALALSLDGGTVGLVGRRLEALEEVAGLVERRGARAVCFPADLVAPDGARRLGERIAKELGATDLLVHSAGVFPLAPAEADSARGHLHAAEILTRVLLPLLRVGPGQIVFINSSLGLPGASATGAYAESKQSLRMLADRLRDEVNPGGIRVLSVYPGRTATPMQAAIHLQEGKPYRPERLLQPEDVAAVVHDALAMPPGAEVTDISIRPMQKP
jgi:NAD(P)-dependent dehydrogenase (short-subunit alcohol dehydrogenase family)